MYCLISVNIWTKVGSRCYPFLPLEHNLIWKIEMLKWWVSGNRWNSSLLSGFFFPLRKQQEEMLRILLYSVFVGCQRVKLGCIHSIKSCSWYPWNIDDKWFKPYQVLPGGCNFQRGKGTTSHGWCPGFNNPEMYTTAVDRIENRHE